MPIPDNQPAFYFPLSNGRYEVKPGFFPFSADCGNGLYDSQLFQFDNTFADYRKNKLSACRESQGKYICLSSPELPLFAVNQFIVDSLCTEHPDFFSFAPKQQTLVCRLTGEQLVFSSDYELDDGLSHQTADTPYLNSWDALAMQLQEDLAIMQVNKHGEGRLVALHLCAPNHWGAEDKIDKDFLSIHQSVPGMQRINQRANKINLACLHKGPFVRFAWGLATDNRLNHHPVAPENIGENNWHGRQFTLSRPELYLRVERQTLTGFIHEGLVLFTIRTYFYDVAQLPIENRQQLLDAIHTMSDEVLLYKGLNKSKLAVCEWLTAQIAN